VKTLGPPTGLKPPPRHAPARLRSTSDLRTLQRLVTHAVVRPLAPGDRLQARWIDGRPMREVAEEFIKPNDRLSACDRLEIYNRMYWFRLFEAIADDSPGLKAALGERKFHRLAQAYLAKYPSRSFSLRNLCSRLPDFIRDEPSWTRPRTALAHDLARFEWAQTVGFDGAARPVLDPAPVTQPQRLRIGLQPYLTLLAVGYPVDDFVLAVKRRNALRSEASNAVEAGRAGRRAKRVPRPRPARTYLAVHRLHGTLYYRRLEPAEYRILSALAAGQPLGRAVVAGGKRLRPDQVSAWFAAWMKLGWLCPAAPRPRRP